MMKTILPHLLMALLLTHNNALGGVNLTVLAAASLKETLEQAARLYEHESSNTVHLAFAASGALARQVDSGEPVDLFISAAPKWITHLQDRDRLLEDSVIELLRNRLVLIAPKNKPLDFSIERGDALPAQPITWLAIGDPRSAPVGEYAREALDKHGWYDAMKSRLVSGADARQVLLYVQRGEADAGIVYATDAMASSAVTTVALFPESSHRPILYPAAICRSAPHPVEAAAFLRFLQCEKARALFTRAGFEPAATNLALNP